MKTLQIKSALLMGGILASALITSASAAVVFGFDTNAEGFVAGTASSVAQDSYGGGSLKVTGAPGFGDFWESSTQAATIAFGSGDALATELGSAYVNGGTISFSVTIFGDDFAWVDGDRPGTIELQVKLGTANDTEVGLLTIPLPGASVTKAITMGIVQGTGNQFNGTNGTINFNNAASGNIYFGFKDKDDFFTTSNFYLDDVTVSAVPEPSSMALLSMIGLGLFARRRR